MDRTAGNDMNRITFPFKKDSALYEIARERIDKEGFGRILDYAGSPEHLTIVRTTDIELQCLTSLPGWPAFEIKIHNIDLTALRESGDDIANQIYENGSNLIQQYFKDSIEIVEGIEAAAKGFANMESVFFTEDHRLVLPVKAKTNKTLLQRIAKAVPEEVRGHAVKSAQYLTYALEQPQDITVDLGFMQITFTPYVVEGSYSPGKAKKPRRGNATHKSTKYEPNSDLREGETFEVKTSPIDKKYRLLALVKANRGDFPPFQEEMTMHAGDLEFTTHVAGASGAKKGDYTGSQISVGMGKVFAKYPEIWEAGMVKVEVLKPFEKYRMHLPTKQ